MVQAGRRSFALLRERQPRSLLEPPDVRNHWRGKVFSYPSIFNLTAHPSFLLQTTGRSKSIGVPATLTCLQLLSLTAPWAFTLFSPPTSPAVMSKAAPQTAPTSSTSPDSPDPHKATHSHSNNPRNGSAALQTIHSGSAASLSRCRTFPRRRVRTRAASCICETSSRRQASCSVQRNCKKPLRTARRH